MIKTRKQLKNRYKNTRRFVAYCFIFAILFFGATQSIECDELDLLQMPAVESDKAENAILMDVKRVDSHLAAVGEWGHILYSDKMCDSWFQAEVPVSVTMTAVYFSNNMKGWAVGHDGVVLHTKDGGKTWVKQLDGNQINTLVYDQLLHLIKDREQLLENQKENMTVDAQEILKKEIENLGFL